MRCILIREIPVTFDIVLKKIPRELKRQGFELLTIIRVDKQLRDSLGVEYKRCAILTISNLQLAYKAMLREEESALLQFFPVFVYEKDGKTALAAIRPTQLFPILLSTCREDEPTVLEKKLGEVVDTFCKKISAKEKKKELQTQNNLIKAVA